MLLSMLAVLIYLAVLYLVYRTVLKDQKNVTLQKRVFGLTLLSGAIPCAVCIIIFELLFDSLIYKSDGSLLGEILTAFLRAALIEEFFKMVFCRRAIKKHKPVTKTEYALLCGIIGAGFGIVEKLAYGGGVILIVNAFLPLHVFFQFLMGSLLYEKRGAAAFFLPFLVHGLWDSLLAVAGALLEVENNFLAATGGLVLFAVLIAAGIIIEIKTVKRMKAATCERDDEIPQEAV